MFKSHPVHNHPSGNNESEKQKEKNSTCQATVSLVFQKNLKGESKLCTPDEIGHKAYNSLRVKSILSSSQSKIKTDVPPLKVFFHSDVREFLDGLCSGWRVHWGTFKSEYRRTGTLNKAALEALQALREYLPHAFPSFPIERFIENEKALIIMRSSGQGEDSADSSNPGGNESVPSIKNDPKYLREGAAVVVSSYFSNRSVEQRQSSGEDVTQDPLLSFYGQLMVGERKPRKNPEKIPSCGVHYTRDPFNSGVSITQAGLGHNQGIVDGTVEFDTYYRDSTGKIHAVLCKKPKRLAPLKGEKGLYAVANPSERSLKGAIPSEVLELLDDLGREIEREFGQPMDIEWVYDPVINCLWIVQARPIRFNTPTDATLLSSSLKDELESVEMEIIVAPGSTAILVDGSDQWIEGSDSEVALHEKYFAIEDLDKRRQVKVVISRHMDPPLAHAPAFFREQKVLTVYLPEEVPIPTGRLLFDVQRQRIYSIPEGVSLDGLIEQGLFRHPVSPIQSLTPIAEKEWDSLLKEKFPSIRVNEIYPLIGKNIDQALERLAECIHEGFESKEAAKACVAYLTLLFAKNRKIIQNYYPELGERLDRLSKHFALNSSQLISQLDDPDHFSKEEILLNVRWVESLLIARPKKNVLQQDSLQALLKEAKARDPLTPGETVEERTARYRLLPYITFLINDRMRDYYRTFVNEVAKNCELAEEAIKTLDALQSLGMLDDTLHAVFEIRRSVEEGIFQLQEVLKGFSEKDKEDISKIQQVMEVVERIEANPEIFADPKLSPPAREALYTQVLHPLNALCRQASTFSFSVRNVFFSKLEMAKEVIDCCIKIVKGSGLEDYETLVKEMTMQFYKLSEIAVAVLAEETQDSHFLLYNSYYKWWGEKLWMAFDTGEMDKETAMKPSPDFDGRASVVTARNGAGAFLNARHEPKSIEDGLTLAHKNLAICVVMLNLYMQYIERFFPLPLQNLDVKLNEAVVKVKSSVFHYELPDWIFSQKAIKNGKGYLELNWPMRWHSSALKVIYHAATGQVQVINEFYGHNEGNRLVEMQRVFLALSKECLQDIACKSTYSIKRSTLITEWTLPLETFSKRTETIFRMINHTFQLSWWQDNLRDNPDTIQHLQRDFIVEEAQRHVLATVKDIDTDIVVFENALRGFSQWTPRVLLKECFQQFKPQSWKDLIAVIQLFDEFVKERDFHFLVQNASDKIQRAIEAKCLSADQFIPLLKRLQDKGAQLPLLTHLAARFKAANWKNLIAFADYYGGISKEEDLSFLIENASDKIKKKIEHCASAKECFALLERLKEKGASTHLLTTVASHFAPASFEELFILHSLLTSFLDMPTALRVFWKVLLSAHISAQLKENPHWIYEDARLAGLIEKFFAMQKSISKSDEKDIWSHEPFHVLRWEAELLRKIDIVHCDLNALIRIHLFFQQFDEKIERTEKDEAYDLLISDLLFGENTSKPKCREDLSLWLHKPNTLDKLLAVSRELDSSSIFFLCLSETEWLLSRLPFIEDAERIRTDPEFLIRHFEQRFDGGDRNTALLQNFTPLDFKGLIEASYSVYTQYLCSYDTLASWIQTSLDGLGIDFEALSKDENALEGCLKTLHAIDPHKSLVVKQRILVREMPEIPKERYLELFFTYLRP